MQERCTGSLLLHTILTPPTELGNVLKQKVKASKKYSFRFLLSTHAALAPREMMGPETESQKEKTFRIARFLSQKLSG